MLGIASSPALKVLGYLHPSLAGRTAQSGYRATRPRDLGSNLPSIHSFRSGTSSRTTPGRSPFDVNSLASYVRATYPPERRFEGFLPESTAYSGAGQLPICENGYDSRKNKGHTPSKLCTIVRALHAEPNMSTNSWVPPRDMCVVCPSCGTGQHVSAQAVADRSEVTCAACERAFTPSPHGAKLVMPADYKIWVRCGLCGCKQFATAQGVADGKKQTCPACYVAFTLSPNDWWNHLTPGYQRSYTYHYFPYGAANPPPRPLTSEEKDKVIAREARVANRIGVLAFVAGALVAFTVKKPAEKIAVGVVTLWIIAFIMITKKWGVNIGLAFFIGVPLALALVCMLILLVR